MALDSAQRRRQSHGLVALVALAALAGCRGECLWHNCAATTGPTFFHAPTVFLTTAYRGGYAVARCDGAHLDPAMVTTILTGFVSKTGGASVSDSLAVTPNEEEQTLSERCTVQSGGETATMTSTLVVAATTDDAPTGTIDGPQNARVGEVVTFVVTASDDVGLRRVILSWGSPQWSWSDTIPANGKALTAERSYWIWGSGTYSISGRIEDAGNNAAFTNTLVLVVAPRASGR